MMNKLIVLVLLGIVVSHALAQPSKDGPKVVNAAGVIINEYTAITGNINAGGTSIPVSNASLNSNGRFSAALSAGDMILIIQMQGASINTAPDSTWGSIASYKNAGNYEFVEVASAAGNKIMTQCPLQHNYTGSGKAQVVRVPRYSTLTIAASGSVVSSNWDGATGGLVVAEVAGSITIDGTIDVSAKGFRGGALDNGSGGGYPGFASVDSADGAEKGEGIAGYKNDYVPYGGPYGRGAPANGGGGGNAHNASGGGGGNAGLLAYTGNGNPDNSNASWAAGWNTEYAGFANSTSSGGGRGGCSFNSKDADPLVYSPGDWFHWRGDGRQNVGGKGGRPLDYSGGRIFMGGGGGAGDADNNEGGRGANGGGLVYLTTCSQITGTGKIIASGEAAPDVVAIGPGDAVGGGGAGGTIVLNAKGGVSGVSLLADGGKGGNHSIAGPTTYGPGGGGGGGYIAISSGSPAQSVKGGANGVTSSYVFATFPSNSATMGGAGASNAILQKNPVLVVKDTTICPGNTATLSANYKAPFSATAISWFKTTSRNSFLATGNTFTSGVLFKDTIFYVGSCLVNCSDPLIPVHVTVSGTASKLAGPSTSICSGDSIHLGKTPVPNNSYTWSPANNLNNTNTAQPLFSAINQTTGPMLFTYFLSSGTGNCISKDTVIISVNPSPVAVTGNDTAICSGSSVQLGGPSKTGYSYSWSPATSLNNAAISNPVFTAANTGSGPVVTTLVLSTTLNSCKASGTIKITVTNTGGSVEAGADQSICSGKDLSLGSSPVAGTKYSWAPINDLSNAAIANPVLHAMNNGNIPFTTRYILTADQNGCKSMDTVTIMINPSPVAIVGQDTSICSGTSIQLGGPNTVGYSYSWSPAAKLDNGAVSNPVFTDTNNGTGPVTSTLVLTTTSNGCKSSNKVNVTVSQVIPVSAGIAKSSCSGMDVALGTPPTVGIKYSWSPATGLSNSAIANPILNFVNKGTSAVSFTYSLTATLNACKSTDTVTVQIKPKVLAVAGPDTSVCSGADVSLGSSPIANYQYSWNPAVPGNPAQFTSKFASNSQSNKMFTYVLTASNLGCSATDTVVVTAKPFPVANAGGPSVTMCSGTSRSIGSLPQANVSYSWSPSIGLDNSGIANPVLNAVNSANTTSSTKFVLTTNLNGCQRKDSILVNTDPSPTANAGQDTVACQELKMRIGQTSNPGFTYQWTPVQYLDDPMVSNPNINLENTSGNKSDYTYTLKVSSGSCSSSSTINISLYPKPSISKDTMVCQGALVTLVAKGGKTYRWTTEDTASVITIKANKTQVYRVKIDGACKVTDSVTVTLKNENSNGIYIPNSFSPNDDGLNDLFIAQGTAVEKFHAVILNRWGEEIYSWSDIMSGWDGKSQGILNQEEVYIYYIKAKQACSTERSYKGIISLIK